MLICCMDNCEFNNLIISDDENVRCWLCDEYAHIKCAGISENVLGLMEMKSGLKWSCEDCRVIKSQMGRYMRQTRMEISELFSEVRAVHEKYLKLESAFASHLIDCQGVSNSVDTVSQPVKLDKPNSADIVTEGKTKSAESHYEFATLNEPTAKNWHQNAAPVALPIIPIPDILRAVPPLKAVFVSRLTTSTTEDALKHYIVAKLSYPDPDDIVVRKIYNKQRRKISSFKVLAPDLIYSRILSPEFWPEHIVVHEFLKKHDLKSNNF
ncbi:uncharacterized protein LOC119560218 [Drosophila subpulchrella]|uniref:uncharacterized protein LOC119560218 n=1 Tax=Drosophila subpulchrella TaxID=1486046 RepID=UPI0018A1431D|nr:uncharacterized protein LOC119560218 [Drosophila subpulchrella]